MIDETICRVKLPFETVGLKTEPDAGLAQSPLAAG